MNKIIKFAFVLVISAFFAIPSLAQEGSKFGKDSVKCIEEISIYTEYFKNRNYKAALPHWQYIYENCPRATKNIYNNADKIYGHLLKRERRPLERKKLVNKFEEVYLSKIKYFGQEGNNLARLGIELLRLDKRNKYQAAYKYLKKSIELKGVKSHPAAIQTLMTAALQMQKKKKITDDEFIATYELLMGLLDKSTAKAATVEKVRKGINKFFLKSSVANAETLEKVFKPKFEANPTDEVLLVKIATMLEAVKGTGTELYATVAKKRFEIKPDSKAAYGIYKLYRKKQSFKEASKFLKKAAECEEDKSAKADYYLELASITMAKLKNYKGARTYARESIKLVPSNGKAYILIGKMYAADYKSNGGTPFEKSCVFWAVVDKFAKAKRVDPTSAGEANDLISKYSVFFPLNDEMFFNGLQKGDKYVVKGWINESTSARSKKE